MPALPTVSLIANSYGHCQKEMALGGAAGTAAEFLKELAGRAVDGPLTADLCDTPWQCLKQRLGAHDITHYRELVRGG